MHINTRFDYYQSLRKTHPDHYWSRKTQHLMLKEQRQMGDAFYRQLELDLQDMQP